jgi:hypothetical protein
MDNTKATFLPFHAINQFMVPEYRLSVLQRVFGGFEKLSGPRKGAINGLVKRLVSVPGFRNSGVAPVSLKIKSSVGVFERSAEFTAQVIMAWSELNPDLRQQVYDLLVARSWEILPADADRTRLPGFLTAWPKGEDFDALDKAFLEAYPDKTASDDDVRLMVVWLSGRLPYDVESEESPDQDAG